MRVKRLTLWDLEEAMEYIDNNQTLIHQLTFDFLSDRWIKKKKFRDVDLLKIKLRDDEEMDEMILTIFEDEWEAAIEMGLRHFEDLEEYEKCSQINKFLTTIKTN